MTNNLASGQDLLRTHAHAMIAARVSDRLTQAGCTAADYADRLGVDLAVVVAKLHGPGRMSSLDLAVANEICLAAGHVVTLEYLVGGQTDFLGVRYVEQDHPVTGVWCHQCDRPIAVATPELPDVDALCPMCDPPRPAVGGSA